MSKNSMGVCDVAILQLLVLVVLRRSNDVIHKRKDA